MRRVRTSAMGMVAWMALACALAAPPAHAGNIDDAKNAGWIGEQADGYLGIVDANAPASARALVQEVNAGRRERYAQIAVQNGVEVDQVARLSGKKLIDRAPPGRYVKPQGRWVKK